jgi:hypothetical protein
MLTPAPAQRNITLAVALFNRTPLKLSMLAAVVAVPVGQKTAVFCDVGARATTGSLVDFNRTLEINSR